MFSGSHVALPQHLLSLLSCFFYNKKHLKNVGPIRHCEPPHAACSNSIATPGEWQSKIDVHNDNA